MLASSIILMWSMIQLQDSENPRLNELANSTEAFLLYLNGDINFEGSIGWRRQLIDNGLSAFQKSYGFGLGAGGTVANQEIIGPVAGRFTSMHNFWIEVLVEGGAVVAIIFFFWIISIANQLFFISRNTQSKKIKYYGESFLLSIIGFIPAAIASSSTVYFFSNVDFVWSIYLFD